MNKPEPQALHTTGDLLNIVLPALDAAGVILPDQSVDHQGFFVRLNGHLVAVTFRPTDPAIVIHEDGTVGPPEPSRKPALQTMTIEQLWDRYNELAARAGAIFDSCRAGESSAEYRACCSEKSRLIGMRQDVFTEIARRQNA